MNSYLVVFNFVRRWDYDASPLRSLRKSDQDHFLGSGNGCDLVKPTHPIRKSTSLKHETTRFSHAVLG